MSMDARAARLLPFLTAVLMVLLSSTPSSAHDEVVYFSAQGGGSFSRSFTNIDNVGGSFEPGTTASDLELKNSALYGAKAGIYSRSRIVGVEAEVFRTHPHIIPQRQTFHEPTFGPSTSNEAGSTTRVTTWAANIVGRFPVDDKVTVHAGVGPAIIHAHMTREGDTISSTRAGVNTQLGLTYLLFPQLAAFLEWKYNHARFNFPTGPNTVGFHADYNPHAFVAGVTYMVNWASPISLREIMRDIFGE